MTPGRFTHVSPSSVTSVLRYRIASSAGARRAGGGRGGQALAVGRGDVFGGNQAIFVGGPSASRNVVMSGRWVAK